MVNPAQPVFVISKGRWESRLTVRCLEKMGVPHRVVVEPQEHEQYASVMDAGKLLVLPFSNLGRGSIPARNWVWERSVAEGARWHWIIDDNISGFYRLHMNLKVPVADGTAFRSMEEFASRFSNVGQAGPNYFMFASRKTKMPPFVLNTRVYSCILLRNDLPLRWRGRYNEDTDLSLRILKSGLCTILFNAFLAFKQTTMTMKGGNTDELYRQEAGFDGRLEMARSLQRQHPDVTKVVRKWGRWQHSVDYSGFTQKLVRGTGTLTALRAEGAMRLQIRDDDGNWATVDDPQRHLPGGDVAEEG